MDHKLYNASIEDLRQDIQVLASKLRTLKAKEEKGYEIEKNRRELYLIMLKTRRQLLLKRYADLGLKVEVNGPHPRRPRDLRLVEKT